jgi:hypothetical protein
MSSAWEHFFAATLMLASAGPIKHRLAEAFRRHLADLDAEQVPQEIRDEFSSLCTCMCCVRPLHGETAVQATVRKMSDVEACSLATSIVNMLGVIARQHSAAPRLKLRAVGED